VRDLPRHVRLRGWAGLGRAERKPQCGIFLHMYGMYSIAAIRSPNCRIMHMHDIWGCPRVCVLGSAMRSVHVLICRFVPFNQGNGATTKRNDRCTLLRMGRKVPDDL